MSRANVVMAVAVVGLGAFYYFHDVKGKPEREKAEVETKRFFPGLEKPKVVGLKVEQLKAPTALSTPFQRDIQRQNGVWVLQGDPPQVLRTSSLGNAIKSLAELQWTENFKTMTPAPDRAEFGLDKPSYRLTLTDKQGKSYAVLLGDKTPDAQGYYASLDDNSPVCAINGTMPELLDSSTDTVRETSLVVFEPSSANKIRLEGKAFQPIEVSLEKARESEPDSEPDDGIEITDLNEKWLLRQPEEAPADGNKVRNLLWDWRNVKLGRFMSPKEKVDFSHPTLRMTCWVDGQKEPFVLEVGGAVDAKPGLYYARRFPPSETMVVELSDFKLLEPTALAFRERHFYVFQPEDAQRLSGSLEGQAIEAQRSGDNWKPSQPAPPKTDPEKAGVAVGDLVWDIKNLEWNSQVAADQQPKEWKERASLEVLDKSKKTLAKLSLGPVTSDGKGAYVKNDKGEIFTVEKDPLSRWKDIRKRMEPTPQATPTATPSATPTK